MATPATDLAVGQRLDRKHAVPAIVGDHEDFLIVCGLAGSSKDIAALTSDGDHVFTMAGAMGAACSVGLGLALARPKQRVLVVTGDGELLMNVGSLATVATVGPKNLSILCVDNEHYGETGYQRSHTTLGVDLETMARGAGFTHSLTVEHAEQLAAGHDALRHDNESVFVNLKVSIDKPPAYKRLLDPAAARLRFKQHVQKL